MKRKNENFSHEGWKKGIRSVTAGEAKRLWWNKIMRGQCVRNPEAHFIKQNYTLLWLSKDSVKERPRTR
jgi:hypothetical protein